MMQINYLAVIVAAVIQMAIGFLWYGPLFGKPWMKMVGFTEKDKKKMQKKAGPAFAGGFATALITAFVLAVLYDYMGISTLQEGAQIALLIWLGFVATVQMGAVLWEAKPVSLWILNTSYSLVNLLIIGMLIAVW